MAGRRASWTCTPRRHGRLSVRRWRCSTSPRPERTAPMTSRRSSRKMQAGPPMATYSPAYIRAYSCWKILKSLRKMNGAGGNRTIASGIPKDEAKRDLAGIALGFQQLGHPVGSRRGPVGSVGFRRVWAIFGHWAIEQSHSPSDRQGLDTIWAQAQYHRALSDIKCIPRSLFCISPFLEVTPQNPAGLTKHEDASRCVLRTALDGCP